MERLTFDRLIIPTSDRSDGASTIVASGPHAPAHAARHGGTRMNRISATENEGLDQSRCNSPAGNTKIFWKCLLGADPRKPRGRSNRHRLVDEPAPDTGGSGSGGRPCPDPWPDTVVGHARLANAELPAGRPHCNTALADDPAGTASRIPSTGTIDAEDDAGQVRRRRDSPWRSLEPCPIPGHAEAGPRELRTPKRSSRGAERLIPLRDAFYRKAPPPASRRYTEPLKPPSANRVLAPVVPRKWLPLSPPPTRRALKVPSDRILKW
jgi:hypothetical protein